MTSSLQPRSSLNIALWIAQILVGAPFIFFGAMKIVQPIVQLAIMMPWTGQVSEAIVRLLGVVDVAGGIGLLLPGITGIKPRLTLAAAVGSIVLQIAASIFHLSRGEGAMTPLNLVFLLLLAFILWGRLTRAPLTSSVRKHNPFAERKT